jgi:hypothetical protein
MIWHLTKKELREHWRALILLLLFEAALIWLNAAGGERRGGTLSRLTVLKDTLTIFVPLSAHVLSHGVFTKELRSQTILFLEALPVNRALVVGAKLLVVTLGTLAIVALAYAQVVPYAARVEVIDARFAVILAARAVGFALAVLGIAFLAAVLGRYRVALYLSLLVMVFMVDDLGGDSTKLGPLALVLDRFALEREVLPVRSLLDAAAVFLGSGGAALLILFMREGSIAVLLGERMSHREKVLVAGLLIGSVFVSVTLVEKKTKDPYRLTEATVLHRRTEHAELDLKPPEDAREGEAERLAEALTGELEDIATELAIPALPPVFVVHRGDLDGDRFEGAEIAKREGVLVRSNLSSPLFDPADLAARIAELVLDAHSHERASFEPRMWLRDGLAQRWSLERSEHRDGRRKRLLLRALYASERGFGLHDAERWWTVRDQLGPSLASALAWASLDALEAKRGKDALVAFVREAIGPRPSDDVRSVVREHSRSVGALLEARAGIGMEELVKLTKLHLNKERAGLIDDLAAAPRLEGTVSIDTLSELSRGISYRVVLTSSNARASHYSVLYRELGAIDDPIDLELTPREESSSDLALEGSIPRSFSAGARIYVGFLVRVPELGCEVVSTVVRRTLP